MATFYNMKYVRRSSFCTISQKKKLYCEGPEAATFLMTSMYLTPRSSFLTNLAPSYSGLNTLRIQTQMDTSKKHLKHTQPRHDKFFVTLHIRSVA